MTRNISTIDLINALQRLPNRFTVKQASEIDPLFKISGVGHALQRYAGTKRITSGVTLRCVGKETYGYKTKCNGRQIKRSYSANVWEWGQL
ncbi:MAG: hypothetical protein KAJ03_09480 [Gammaproteobacteria bacterium]|nr:hypothetical protein [Gammaproteobacteria bacterium]